MGGRAPKKKESDHYGGKPVSGVAMKEQKSGDGVNNNDNGDAKSGLPGESRSQKKNELKKNVSLSSVSDGAKNSPDHEGEAQDGGE